MLDVTDTYAQLAEEPYESRGIIHSEIGLLIHTCRSLGIERIIESGRARAQSTYLLAKYMPDVEIHSIEKRMGEDEAYGFKRVVHMPNVKLYTGDGARHVEQLIRLYKPVPTAVLLDGPKGKAAVDILVKCFAFPHVLVGFIHDMRKLDHGEPSPYRSYAMEQLPNCRFSDDPELTSGTSWMDANVLKAGGPCGPQHEEQFGSYGPTLGAFFNPQQ